MQAASAAIGRHRALLLQGFFADGVVFQPLTPDEPGGGGDKETKLGRPHQH
jgi:hypothetical protein